MQRTRISRIICSIALGATLVLPGLSHAQGVEPATDKVASIVAVVGDSVITSAFLLDASARRLQELRDQKRPLPSTPEAMKALQDTLISERIEELVILQSIARDTSYKVSDESLRAAVESRYAKLQADNGGPVPFSQALKQSGLTVDEMRTMLSTQIRTEELFRQFRQRISEQRQAPKATEKEIEEFFPLWQASRGPRPAIVSFQQIVVRVTPSDTAAARAKAKADSIYQMLLKDRGSFAELAKKYSDDPGSREKGGEFGWFKESDGVAREFIRASFNAPVGTITPPVKTQFGYHIIEVERRRGGQAQVRHILIAPTINDADLARAMARADTAASRLRAGGDIQSIIRQYGDPTEDLTMTAVDPAALRQTAGIDLTSAAKGDIVGPTATPPGPGQYVMIARVTDTSPAGQWSLDDPGIRDNIRSIVETQKLLNEVVAELKQKTYISIRPH